MKLDDLIGRINELYHLSKERPLTEEELKEQGELRALYIQNIRANVRGQMSQIRIVEKDGSIHPVVSVKEQKTEFRKTMRAVRAGIPAERKKEASETLKTQVLQIAKINKPSAVLLYASTDEEVPTDETFEALTNNGFECFYPVCSEDHLTFCAINHLDELKPAAFGIREPDINNKHFEACENDKIMILLPGLSFTDKGERIGYGKGYYDTFLQSLKGSSPAVKTFGICFKECRSKEIPKEKHDVDADVVLFV